MDRSHLRDAGPPHRSRREGGLRERDEREDLPPHPWRIAISAAAPGPRGPASGPRAGPPPADRPGTCNAPDVPDPRVPGSWAEEVAAPTRPVAVRRALKREDASTKAVALSRGGH